MDTNKERNIKKTIDVFDMKIDEKMLPGGSNPLGRGHLLVNSQDGLAMADLQNLVLGPVEPQRFVTEEGNKVWMEKMNRHARAYGRVGQASDDDTISDNESLASYATGFSTQTSDVGDIASTWDEVMIAKNKGKFNTRKLKIIRKELDDLLKKAEAGNDSLASSSNSTSTWASSAPTPVIRSAIDKFIKGYDKMSIENKIETLKNELPPFNIDDLKYRNLKYALGLYL